jgi:hypothetical protein
MLIGVLWRGKGDAPQIGAVVDFNGTVYPGIVVEELVIFFLRGSFGGEGCLIAKDTRMWLIQTRYQLYLNSLDWNNVVK